MWQEKNNSLYQKFEFKDFDEAFEFIEKIAAIARDENHHPDFKNSYNIVEVWLTTHSEGGITDKDQKFAQKIDEIFVSNEAENTIKLTEAKLFTDGGSRGNPGPAATGAIILDMEDNVVKKSSTYLGVTTNNQAEYKALLEGLEVAEQIGVKRLSVYMDSELIVKQINGIYKIKNPDLLPIYQKVKNLSGSFEKLSFTHVPRALNKLADAAVNKCLDKNTL